MILREQVLLAEHTTLRVGGTARWLALCTNDSDIVSALAFAQEQELPVAVLGGGSNTLAPDAGFSGLVIKIDLKGITFVEDAVTPLVTAGAGESWDALVRVAGERSLWGIENLAGIPGTVGGAVVQNIGAYGAELSTSCMSVETLSLQTRERRHIEHREEMFGYRTSLFKASPDLIVTQVTLRLSRAPASVLSYPDLQRALAEGKSFETPEDVAQVVRSIREKKFPQKEGSAGSFFKNPVVSHAQALELAKQYPELPQFKTKDGVKVSLAWLLDHALHLTGLRHGGARLYERQPLVIATEEGSSADDVASLADEVKKIVAEKCGIHIEREVETISAKNKSYPHASE